MAALGAGMLGVPLHSFAQQQARVRRIGFLVSGSRPTTKEDQALFGAFMDQLRALGYVEGRDFVMEWRYAENRPERLAGLAQELVKLKCDVLVTRGPPANLAARRATTTTSIPVVVVAAADPMGDGLVSSMARPGGNVTGFSTGAGEYVSKHFDLLVTAVPGLTRLGALQNPLSPSQAPQLRTIEALATKGGVTMQVFAARAVEDLEPAIGAMAQAGVQAVIILGDTFFSQNVSRLAELALRNRIASIYAFGNAEAGGLLSYGPVFADNFRRSAIYVDKILKGAKPGDLPFEQPRQFRLVVNLKTARALGLTMPQSLLLLADRVIE